MNNDKTLMKELLIRQALIIRKERNLTKEQMSELLHITPRAYSDLEKGKYCLSAKSFLYLLLLMNAEDINCLLAEFRQISEEAESQNA